MGEVRNLTVVRYATKFRQQHGKQYTTKKNRARDSAQCTQWIKVNTHELVASLRK